MEARGRSQSAENHECMLTVFDLGTKLLATRPSWSRSAHTTQDNLKLFKGRNELVCMYAGRAPELDCAATAMGIPCDRSGAGRPQTNGILEWRSQEIDKGDKKLCYCKLGSRHHCGT